MPLIDSSTEFGQRVRRRLDDETVGWLITSQVKDGTSQPSPVWFLAEGDDSVRIYSQPDKPKIRNIEAHPTVAFTFNTSPDGDDVVTFHGKARIDHDAPSAADVPAYIAKYASGVAGLTMTPQSFSEEYSVPIRITFTRLRGF